MGDVWANLGGGVLGRAGARRLAATLASALALVAASAVAAPAAPRAVATRAADDLSGIWIRDFGGGNAPAEFKNKPTDPVFSLADGTVIPLRPDAEKIYRERVAMAETDRPWANTAARCLPLGHPQMMMGAPYPLRIVQRPEFIAILAEEGWVFRAIYVNGRHPAEVVPSFMGHSVAHWEGKTLVIDTVALRADTTLNFTGLPHSAKLHVVEHIRRTAPDTLVDMILIDDPVTYSKPFTFKSVFKKGIEEQIEYICERSNIKVDAAGRQIYGDQ